MKEGACFGFYTGEWKCLEGGCKAAVQCKAFVNSDGLDIAADVLNDLLEELPPQVYLDVPSIRGQLSQILEPDKLPTVLKNFRADATRRLQQELVMNGQMVAPGMDSSESAIMVHGLFPPVEDPL